MTKFVSKRMDSHDLNWLFSQINSSSTLFEDIPSDSKQIRNMVLDITVKTLDSQNYQFQADDAWTIQQFKDHIEPTVNVTSNEQRLIFCGRVLQDDKKLADYECNGKVIHLVRRPPPSLDQPAENSSTADSNNNNNTYAGGANDNARFLDENNVLFSAMTLGPEANMNHILRHILSLQQAIYSRSGDGVPVGSTLTEPMAMSDIDRRLHNAARLLRIIVNTIHECQSRMSALPSPSRTRPTNDQSNLDLPRPVIAAASSHSDLQNHEDTMQTSESASTSNSEQSALPLSETTMDDMGLRTSVEGSSRRATRMSDRRSRQSLTTDDLPQTNRTVPRLEPLSAQRYRNENRIVAPRQREQSELDRYLTILNSVCDIQHHVQRLIRRYNHLIDMSRRGGLIVPQASSSTATTTSDNSPTNSNNLDESQTSQPVQSGQLSSTLMMRRRILCLYLPRILHHISHVQHALSEFTVDFTRGRLILCTSSSLRGSPISVRTNSASNNAHTGQSYSTSNRSGSSTANRGGQQTTGTRDLSRPVEGSVTITATTVETTPILSTNLRPQANSTILVSSEPGQAAIHIPVSVPIPHGSISFNFAASPAQSSSIGPSVNMQEGNQSQPADRPRVQMASVSNSTQTAPRPIGVISGRIPLPFDYYLPCNSPWTNPNATHRINSRTLEAMGGRLLNDPSRQPNAHSAETNSTMSAQASFATSASSASTNNAAAAAAPQSQSQSSRTVITEPALDMGLTEVVTNIVGSLFRGPQSNQSSQQTTSGASTNSNQDPLLNIIPELALNAASQILGGVLGLPQQTTGFTAPQSQNAQHQAGTNSTLNSGAVVMDIDIDDSSSSLSESRYLDARESNSPTAIAYTQAQPAQRPSSSNYFNLPQTTANSSSTNDSNNNSGVKYDRRQIVEKLQNHSDWVPIIEADINVMEQHQRAASSNQQFFSDAYLSSIPRKRRRLLTTSPDRVLILQPSPSQAITNLLRRAITNSSLSNAESLDQVLGAISSDSDLQVAYEDYIKSAVEARLRSDFDYSPQKFENSSKYFK